MRFDPSNIPVISRSKFVDWNCFTAVSVFGPNIPSEVPASQPASLSRGVSDALATYLSLAFHTTDIRINRITVDDPENASEADLLAAIPLTERKDEATAVADIQAFMDDIFWEALHPSYPLTAREQWIRILRDYEIVRSPMQYGNPAVRPANTRNPARGFLRMPEHFVVAMMDAGNLRWGACEFSAQSNGVYTILIWVILITARCRMRQRLMSPVGSNWAKARSQFKGITQNVSTGLFRPFHFSY